MMEDSSSPREDTNELKEEAATSEDIESPIIEPTKNVEDTPPVPETTEAPAVKPKEQIASEFLYWIKSHPDYQHLVKSAKTGQSKSSQDDDNLDMVMKVQKFLRDIFIANGDHFHGTAYVTKALKKEAKITASVVTISNLVDFVGNAPVFWFAFKSLGFLPAFGIALILDTLLLHGTNEVATAVAQGKKTNQTWAKTALLMGLIPLNILQTFASGVGAELFNNGSELNQIQAQRVLDETISKQAEVIENLNNFESPLYQSVQTRCLSGEAELKATTPSSPQWDSIYVRLYGTWQDKDRAWENVKLELLPVCRQMTRLENQKNQQFSEYQQAKNLLEQQQQKRAEISNDVIFLERYYPTIYQQHFDRQGQMKSGVKTVAIATENFFYKMLNGKWSELGISLFFFSVSAITSVSACAMAWHFSQRKDVAMSWDENVRQERDRWLHEQVNILREIREDSEEEN